jgi:hypothetical protein
MILEPRVVREQWVRSTNQKESAVEEKEQDTKIGGNRRMLIIYSDITQILEP